MASETELPASIEEQAAHWWVTLRSPDCSDSERRAFGSWLTQSPERVAAYFRTEKVFQASKSTDIRWPVASAATLVREAKSSVEQVSHESWQRPFSASRSKNLSNSRRRLVLATAMALVAAAGGAWLMSAKSQVFQTGFGERRSIVLEDGSRITLNTASRIEVKMRKDTRIVSLSAGEAFFSVVHDPNRVFRVDVGRAELRDVGTQFDVDRQPDRTTVTVVEGRVEVAHALESQRSVPEHNLNAPRTLLLEASDQLVITPFEWQSPQHGIDSRVAVSWTENKLVFVRTPIEEAAEEFNRYNRLPIQIDGEALRRRQITGTFKADDPASFVSFLSHVPGVSIQDRPDGTHVAFQN